MRHVLQRAATIRGFGCALALTVSILTLSGCMTATKDTADAATAEDQVVPVVASADQQQAVPGGYVDQRVSAVGNNPEQQTAYPAGTNAMLPAAADGQPASLTMQSTGVKATASSIFAVQTPNAVPNQDQTATTGQMQGNAPLPVGQQTGVNATSNSLFNAGQTPIIPTPVPLEGASNATAQPGQQVASAEIGADGTPLPMAVPVPSSADTVRESAATTQTAPAEAIAAAKGNVVLASEAEPMQEKQPEPDQAEKSLTLVGLFAAKRKNRNAFNGDRFAKAPAKRTIVAGDVKQQQIAALGFTALPGVQTRSMFATVDDSQPGHDDESAAVEMASLPGLARLAPNGLWLQTETVETGCFQPDLLQMLKVVENHYGRKIMVTSGLRDLKHNTSAGGSRRSLHTTCQAADIQVPGVSKWELADYLRTLPGRGGVGTYCHTESVHIDTGENRDWNWRCRRRKI